MNNNLILQGVQSPYGDVTKDAVLARADVDNNFIYLKGELIATATTSGNTSHAEGQNTSAIGQSSHSEGIYTTTQGNFSHAEGSGSTANGQSSHAEGIGNVANGNYSHAGGNNSVSNGTASFVQGTNSVVGGNNSAVFGDSITGNTDNTVYVPDLVITKYNAIPTGSTSTIGENGSVTWDNSFFYWKANNRWLRISGVTF